MDPNAARPQGRPPADRRRAGIEHSGGSGLEDVRLRHRALPERDLADVALAATCSARGSPRRCWSRR